MSQIFDTLAGGKAALGVAQSSRDELLEDRDLDPDARGDEATCFLAHVLCDFEAGGEGELQVHRGEFVTVIVDAEDPAPEGWCYCQVARQALFPPARPLTEEGLVPWYFLVSAAHAEQEAMARPLPATDAQGGTWHDITVRRGEHGALGLDVGSACLKRLAPSLQRVGCLACLQRVGLPAKGRLHSRHSSPAYPQRLYSLRLYSLLLTAALLTGERAQLHLPHLARICRRSGRNAQARRCGARGAH